MCLVTLKRRDELRVNAWWAQAQGKVINCGMWSSDYPTLTTVHRQYKLSLFMFICVQMVDITYGYHCHLTRFLAKFCIVFLYPINL